MDNLQHEALQRMFHLRRLQPWNEEHALFIKGELAKLEVIDKHDFENFKAFYDKLMDEHSKKPVEQPENEMLARMRLHADHTVPVEPVRVEEVIAPESKEEVKPEEVEVEKEAPKKKGKKKSK